MINKVIKLTILNIEQSTQIKRSKHHPELLLNAQKIIKRQ